MKAFIAIACTLLLCNSASAQLCCGPYLDYQAITDLYLGTVDLTLLPGSPPEAYLGLARVTSLFSQQMSRTEYNFDEIPGWDTRELVGDYRNFGSATFYTTYIDGSCTYATFQNIFFTPPCVPPFWDYVSTFNLGEDYLVDRYGDNEQKNYINVLRDNCLPIAQFATRRNAPAEGVYRFNTEFYTNVTAYSGTIEIPEGCTPEQSSRRDHIERMPLHLLTLRQQAPEKKPADTQK